MKVDEWMRKQRLFERWYVRLRKRIMRFPDFGNEWWNYTNALTIKKILEYSFNQSVVLDVGCGEGRFLKPLIESGRTVIGVDPSLILLRDAKKREPRADLVLAIGEHLPFRSGTFDVILCAATLEHLLSPKLFFKEAGRCLKNGGIICIKQGYEKRINPKIQIDHMRSFTYLDIIKLLSNSGFGIIHVTKIGNRTLWNLTKYLMPFIPLRKMWFTIFRIHFLLGRKKPENAFLAIIIARSNS